jgi:hypothetical protein
MLGKLYALCLCKYVRLLLLHRGPSAMAATHVPSKNDD